MYRFAILTFFVLIATARSQTIKGSPRVVIVGAGASGIAAASKLLQNGIEDVLILEAEDRIGGRIKTIKFDEYLIDEGAQWIFGNLENVVYDLANPLGFTNTSDFYKFEIFNSHGEQLDAHLVDIMKTILTAYWDRRFDCLGTNETCIVLSMKERLAKYPELNSTVQEQLLPTMLQIVYEAEVLNPWYNIAMEGYARIEEINRFINWKLGGYSTILDMLMKKIPDPKEELPILNKTILNAEVNKVDYSREDGKVKLTTEDGKEYIADHVIMTTSLGVLQNNFGTLFNPLLPESKMRGIKYSAYDNICKVHLAFNDDWYNKEGVKNKLLQLRWSQQELEELWNDPKRKWMSYARTFRFVEHKPRLLMLWVPGEAGRLIEERTDEEVLQQITEILNNFFSKTYNVSNPIAMTRSKWNQNKHFRGAYSYIYIDGVCESLGEPIIKNGKPVVLFAGEASDCDNIATVHGAIGTGWREADRLINLYSGTATAKAFRASLNGFTRMYRFAILTFFALIASIRSLAITGSPRVVIVGAGASGIAAASKLLQNGIEDVLVLEAEDRIGGRVKTIKFDEYVIDEGAQWIHGDVGNVAYDMAAPLNLTDHSDPYKFEMFASNGERLATDLVENILKIFIEYIETTSDATMKNCNASFGECVKDRVLERLAQFPELNNTMQEQLLWSMNLMLTSLDPADDWNGVAAQEYKETTEGDRGVNWKLRGYSTILDIMMKKIPNPEEELPVMNKTILNAEVTKVDYSSEDGKIKLTTQDGKGYTADHVIMTPSLGVLKADHETLFNPQLPETKIKAIKTLGYGNACKVHVAFNDDWYNKDGVKNKLMQFVWTKQELEELKKDPKRMWMPYSIGFNVVEHKPRLLQLWVSGKGGRLIDERTDEEVLEQVTWILNSFFSKTYNVSKPVAMTRSKWHQNKHFRGIYSYTSVEAAKANVGNAELAVPIMKNGKPVVLFAGEASSNDNIATVHGAIGTGWREADRLINLYSKTVNTTEKK
nr:uncharacterized protein LOC117223048 [Megalopta genalis]